MSKYEMTRVINVQITTISDVTEYTVPVSLEKIKKDIKNVLNADDVLVTSAQEFLMPKEGTVEGD